jgi:hypothetical protein
MTELVEKLVMLRRFDPRIAERTWFLTPLANSFCCRGEKDKKIEKLKDLLRDMMKTRRI